MTDVLRTAPLSVGRPAPRFDRKWLPLPVLMTGTFLIVLDFFIVNVAMASLQHSLHAGAAAIEWVVAGYGLTFAVLLPAAGRLGDRVGRRRMFATGVAVFTASSLLCGIAPNGEMLVLARLVQGAGGAMISPSVLALLGTLYAGADRARAIGIYATVMGLAAAGGQLVGGILLRLDVAGLGWRTVFLLNVPVGIAALAAVRRCLPEARPPTAMPVDWVGLGIVTVGLLALVFPLVDGRDHGWPWWSFASLTAAPFTFAGLARWQRVLARRGGVPLVDPAWWRDGTFSVGMLTQLVFWCGQASYFLVLALYLQVGRGLSPLQSGAAFMFVAVPYVVASSKASTLVAARGRAVVVTGAALLAVGHLAASAAAIDAQQHLVALAPGLMLAGAGMGLCLAPITTVVLSNVDPARAGAVSGLLSTMQQVGNAIGVAVIGVIFFGEAAHGYAHAFALSTAALAGLLIAVAVCAQRLPAPRSR